MSAADQTRVEGHALAPAPKAGQREWIGLAVLALPCMLYSMDLTVLNLAIPELTAELRPSSTKLLWIVDIYGFLVAGFLVTMGTLGDRIGRRRLLLIGAAAFGAGSLLAAASRSAEALIAARALLGVAAATLAPSTLSLLRTMFVDPHDRTFAIGVWIASFSLGGVIGPLIGGALLEYFWWGSVFLIAVPVMMLLLVVGPMLLPEFRNPKAGRLDLVSVGQSLVATLVVIHALKQAARDGLTWFSAAEAVVGFAVGTLFLRRQRRLVDPHIDLDLFRAREFSVASIANSLVFLAMFGNFLFIAQYLQLMLGLSPWQAGLWTAPSSAGFILGSVLTPMTVRRVPPGIAIAAGLAVAAAGFTALSCVGAPSGLPVLVAGSVIFSLGLAPVTTLATDLMVSTVPPERAGAVAAISETSSELGGALGIAVLGSVGTSVYRSTMSTVAPPDLPADAREAAYDTFGGAVAAAQQLPGHTGMQLLDAARASFGEAFEVCAAISAVVVMLASVMAAVLLRPANASATAKRPS